MADIDLNVKGNADQKLTGIGAAARKTAEDLGLARDRNDRFSASLTATRVTAALAATAIERTADAVAGYIRGIPAGAAATERHERALHQLGGAYEAVRNATMGTVSAEQAVQVQQRLAQAGRQVDSQQLAAITARAREYARATGTELPQALDQMTDALRGGEAEGLQRFGVTVQQGRTKAESFESAIRQITARMGEQAPAALTAAEAQEQFNRSLGVAENQLAATIAKGLELTDFFRQAASWLEELTEGTGGWGRALEAAIGTFQEAIGVGASITPREPTGRAAFAQNYMGIVEELRRAGVDTRRYPMAGALSSATEGERAEALRLLQRDLGQARRAHTSGAALGSLRGALGAAEDISGLRQIGTEEGPTQGTGDVLRNIAGAGARRAADTERQRLAEEERRRRERRQQIAREMAAMTTPATAAQMAAARTAMGEASLQAHAMGTAGGLGLGELRFDEVARMDALRGAATDTGAQRGENEAQRLTRVAGAIRTYNQALLERTERERELATQLREAALAHRESQRALGEQIREGMLGAEGRRIEMFQRNAQVREAEMGIRGVEQGRVLGVFDRDQQQDRVRHLTELRGAMRGLLADTEALLTRAQAEQWSAEQINELLQRRAGLLGQVASASSQLRAEQDRQNASTLAWRDAMVGALGGVAEATGAAVGAWLEGEKSFEDVLADQLRALLLNLAQQSVVEVLRNSALAAFNFALGNVPSATSHIAAAGLWAAVGVAAGAGVANTSPSAAGSSGGRREGGTPRAASVSSGEGARERQQTVVQISFHAPVIGGTPRQVTDALIPLLNEGARQTGATLTPGLIPRRP